MFLARGVCPHEEPRMNQITKLLCSLARPRTRVAVLSGLLLGTAAACGGDDDSGGGDNGIPNDTTLDKVTTEQSASLCEEFQSENSKNDAAYAKGMCAFAGLTFEASGF